MISRLHFCHKRDEENISSFSKMNKPGNVRSITRFLSCLRNPKFTKNYITMKNAFMIFCFAILNLCYVSGQNTNNIDTTSSFTYEIINSANGTFGYDILRDKKLFIHQPNIPGFPGKDGFKTRAAAETVGNLVINKIKNGVMPPAVTTDELKKLGVLEK